VGCVRKGLRGNVKGRVAKPLSEQYFRAFLLMKAFEGQDVAGRPGEKQTQSAEIAFHQYAKCPGEVRSYVRVLAAEDDRVAGEVRDDGQRLAVLFRQLEADQ